MGFEPQKLFIGLIDFFAVLLPGAVVTYLWRDAVSRAALDTPATPLSDGEAWIVFLFVSYLLGHLIFLFGASLDTFYDFVRGATTGGQIRRLANGETPHRSFWRSLASSKLLFDTDADNAVDEVIRLKKRKLEPEFSASAVNAFQWCKARLSKENPEGFATVQRFEADSKFFRSFSLILLLAPLVFAYRSDWLFAGVSLALVLPVMWRYFEQRFKATQQAYYHIIALESSVEAKPVNAQRVEPTTGRTHAGGVVFRRGKSGIEILLISGTKKPEERVLPKGHIKPGESEKVTAVREVLEETGYRARVLMEADDLTLERRGDFRVFLMECVDRDPADDDARENRIVEWVPLGDAVKRATYPATQTLLSNVQGLIAQANIRAKKR